MDAPDPLPRPRPSADDPAPDPLMMIGPRFPGRMIRADELMIADEIYLPIPVPGKQFEMTGRWDWYIINRLRGRLTLCDAEGVEHPAIEAEVYRWACSRDVVFIGHHMVRVRRPVEAGPGSHMNLRVTLPDGIINTMNAYAPRGTRPIP